jgi:hypothetical protein
MIDNRDEHVMDKIHDFTKALPDECQENVLAYARGMDTAVRLMERKNKAEKTPANIRGEVAPAGA